MSYIIKGLSVSGQFKGYANPGNIVFNLISSTASANEGSNFSITLEATNVPNGTMVPYTITGVSSADINGASLTGMFIVENEIAVLNISITADSTTEGPETLVLTLNEYPELNIGVLINDTSVTPAIAYRSQTTSTSSTANLPATRSIGDVIFVLAGSKATSISVPSGWTTWGPSGGSVGQMFRAGGYRVVTGTESNAGVWTGAEATMSICYRSIRTPAPTTNVGTPLTASNTTLTYPSATITLGNWMAYFIQGTPSTALIQIAPTGMVNRCSVTANNVKMAWHDTNGTLTTFNEATVDMATFTSTLRHGFQLIKKP